MSFIKLKGARVSYDVLNSGLSVKAKAQNMLLKKRASKRFRNCKKKA